MDTRDELREQCRKIADEIGAGTYDMTDCDIDDWGWPAHYLNDALDIEYTVSSNFEYLGARVCVALGGPNIYIDTRNKAVQGYWGSDRAEVSYSHDPLGLDDYCCELYEASR